MDPNNNVDGSWQGSGFNKYFQREVVPPIPTMAYGTPFDFSSQFSGFSATQISTGNIRSNNGHVVLDLDNETLITNDGIVERTRLGKLPDGSYGLLINDQNGNTLMEIGGVNFIKSGDSTLELNFDNVQLLFRDAGGNVQGALGNIS
jgi:hypothetical protein